MSDKNLLSVFKSLTNETSIVTEPVAYFYNWKISDEPVLAKRMMRLSERERTDKEGPFSAQTQKHLVERRVN